MAARQGLGTRQMTEAIILPPSNFRLPIVLFLTILMGALLFSSQNAFAREVKVAILMASIVRQAPVDGLQSALVGHGENEGLSYAYEIKNAEGDRSKLVEMATEIIAGKPDIAIAGGGIEADALLLASKGSNIPVIFLSVSSAVDRGIVASMVSSENNFTGIETNDTMLTVKRLWYIKKMLPEAKRIFCFHVPSIVPSVQSLAVAQQSAAELDLEIQFAEVETPEDIQKAAATLSREKTDVILMLPVAPTDKAMGSIIFPKAMAENIPIFGYDENSMKSGAFASYAGSRYANGQQAARLVHKIINGIKPHNIPIETPQKLELIINKNITAKLGIKLSNRIWRMADKVIDIPF